MLADGLTKCVAQVNIYLCTFVNSVHYNVSSGVAKGWFGGFKPHPPKFRKPSKVVPNSTRFENC